MNQVVVRGTSEWRRAKEQQQKWLSKGQIEVRI